MDLHAISNAFSDRLQEGASLARYTAPRLGGSADALLEVKSTQELVEVISLCWANGIPFRVLGSGSNVLISDAGVRGVVVINRARRSRFDMDSSQPTVWAESGANFSTLARQSTQRGLAGLEWAAGIPGTLGGAVVGNAGAHGGDVSGNLILAEILHRNVEGQSESPRREKWPVDRFEYSYRSSVLKRQPGTAVVLDAILRLEQDDRRAIQSRLDEFLAHRRQTQPPGASMGSMFKNPPGDYAGRLLEAAGLKGRRIGDAQISPLHANFFLNLGKASASDVFALIQLARRSVIERFGVELELEIELVGEW